MTTHNFKALGLAFLAVFAMSALAASAAQGAATFEAGAYPATLDAGQSVKHVFTSQNRKLECANVNFDGEMIEASSTLTVSPTYSACVATVLGVKHFATVTMNGCDYLFHAGGTAPNYTATEDIVCPGGAKIVIHIYNAETTEDSLLCTLSFPAQTGLPSLDLTNNTSGSKADIDAKFTVTGIAVEPFPQGALCGMSNKTTTYAGSSTMQMTNGGELISASVSG